MPGIDNQTGYPSIDKPWLKYYREEEFGRKTEPRTVYENIYINNYQFPNDSALIYYGKSVTYRKLFEKTERAKQAFLKMGVKEGDNVSFLMLSCPEMVYSILALNQLGVCANMVNPTFTAEQMRDRINDSEAEIILITDQLFERIKGVWEEICPKIRIIVPLDNSMPIAVKTVAHFKLKRVEKTADTVSWNDFIKAAYGENRTHGYKYKENMPAVMVYSSGTTGASKGIVLTNDGINGTIAHYDNSDFAFNRGDKFLHMGAPWLSTLLVVCLLMPLKKGISVIIEPLFSEETFYEGIKKYKPAMAMSTVSHWLYLLKQSGADKLDLSNMKYPITGGEKVLPETETVINAYLEQRGCTEKLLVGYGMCELGSTAVSNSKNCSKKGSPGYPITGVTVAAFDKDANRELRYGERGEIRVLTPNRMKEYYKRPDATAEFFWKDEEGREWGCTGDVGYVDEDGFVWVEGRATDYFTTKSGSRVYNFDIENVILETEGVYQCEVVGKRTADGCEEPVAFAVLNESAQREQTMAEIRKHCQEKLAAEQIPDEIRILESFPVKPSGKRDMEQLKKMAEKG